MAVLRLQLKTHWTCFITVELLLTHLVTFDPGSEVSHHMPHLGFDLHLCSQFKCCCGSSYALVLTASDASKGMLLGSAGVDSVSWEKNAHTFTWKKMDASWTKRHVRVCVNSRVIDIWHEDMTVDNIQFYMLSWQHLDWGTVVIKTHRCMWARWLYLCVCVCGSGGKREVFSCRSGSWSGFVTWHDLTVLNFGMNMSVCTKTYHTIL